MVSATVAFPDFSSNREHDVQHASACTLQPGDVGPSWVRVAGDLDTASALRLDGALALSRRCDGLEIVDLDPSDPPARPPGQPRRTDDPV
jgi:hypothetical protein